MCGDEHHKSGSCGGRGWRERDLGLRAEQYAREFGPEGSREPGTVSVQ